MKVLIVDDEPLIRRSLEKVFERAHHQVLTADNGFSGVELWKQLQPDIVILDVLMPGYTGPEVIGEVLGGRETSTVVILISAYSGEYDLDSVRQLGADLFLSKPFDNIKSIVGLAEKCVGEKQAQFKKN